LLWPCGTKALAIETGELAVKKADADSNYPAGSTKYLKRRLQVFKAAQQTDAQKNPEK
jgi:plasmid maintenance system killer protein